MKDSSSLLQAQEKEVKLQVSATSSFSFNHSLEAYSAHLEEAPKSTGPFVFGPAVAFTPL